MKKQIEEMIERVRMNTEACQTCTLYKERLCDYNCELCEDIQVACETLYNAGYRKQIEGEWEKRTFIIFDSEKVGYTCSECNTTWDTETKFCPNCGARMKGENNE